MDIQLSLGESDYHYLSLFDSIMSIFHGDLGKNKRMIIENFIQAYYQYNYSDPFNFMEEIKLNEYDNFVFYLIPRNLLTNTEHFLTFCIECINKERYVITNIDMYHLSNYKYNYKINHYNHPILLYGYNNKERQFLCADYFDFTNYTLDRCDFDQLSDSFLSGSILHDYLNGIILVEYNPKPENNIDYIYNVNVNKVYRELCGLTLKGNKTKITSQGVGICIFEDYFEHLKKIYHFGEKKIQARHLCFLKVHIDLMMNRVAHFNNISPSYYLGEIQSDISLLKAKMTKAINMNIKMNHIASSDKKIAYYDKLVEYLQSVPLLYKNAIERFINFISYI
jgi:hypothetical protein